MRSFNSYLASPVLTFQPQHPHHSSFNNMDPFSNGGFRSPRASAWPSSTSSPSPPRSAAGRKRSRDDAASNLEEDCFTAPPPVVPAEPENQEDWEYGEGMTIIKKGGKEYVADSTSQTQDWAEERAAEEKAKAAAAAMAARPVIRAAKSQRLNLSATPAILEEPSLTDDGLTASPGSPERHSTPAVDDFTRHLGIGWSAVHNSGPDVLAAARGWAKFIENHFPVTNAKIQLTSKGLASYLVEATEGYFLFAEDLKQGRLVSTSLEKTWVNLSSPVPVFDGDMVMEATQTPREFSQPAVDLNAVTDDHKMLDPMTTRGLPIGGIAHSVSPQLTEVMTAETAATSTNGPPQSMEVEMDMS